MCQLGCRVGSARARTEQAPPSPRTPVSVPAPNCCPSGVLCRPYERPVRQSSVSRRPVPSPRSCSGWVGCACSPSCSVRPAACDSQPPGAAAAPAARLKCRKSRACAGPGLGQGRCQRCSTPEAPEAVAAGISRSHRCFSGSSDEKELRGKRMKTIKGGMVAYTPVTPVLGRWRQEDHKPEDSLGHIEGLQPGLSI